MLYIGQVVEQSLLMLPLVLGLYVTFGVQKIADLSMDGSFVLGSAIFAVLSTSGMPIVLAIMASVGTGMVAGAIGAFVQHRNRVDPLITGILLAFILHSLSLLIMQRPNIGLLHSNIFYELQQHFGLSKTMARLVFLVPLAIVLIGFLSMFLSCRLGLWLKAFGNSQNLVSLLGRSPESLRLVGLSLGNGLAALSGCLTAQSCGYADINMGFGQALIGIAMLLLGRELVHFFVKHAVVHDAIAIACTLLGIVLYYFLTNELIRIGLDPVYLKMAIGVFLIGFLVASSKRATRFRSLLP